MEDLTQALPGLSLSEHSTSQAIASADNGAHAGDVAKPPTPPAAEGVSSQPGHQAQQPMHAPAPVPEYEAVDAAIRQALADPTQRVTVLKCEDLVEKFLADSSCPALQFPASFSSYQRMLAHRVGQYYGLQTSTVDYEESQGRVLAIRTMHCRVPKPRLRDLDVRSDPVAQRTNTGNGLGGPVVEKPRLLRRQEDDRSQLNSSEHSLNQSPARTMKERHEIYMKAREELGLGSGPQDGTGTGRGGPGGRFGAGGRMDGGRGRKAVFRDKDKDLSDPDYRRGMNRFNGTARFDPSFAAMPAGGIYQVPTYASEFPVLNRMPSGGPTPSGRPHMQQHQQQAHQLTPGAQPHPMAAHTQHQGQIGPGAWGQQAQSQGPGVRPPPPPPPPHHHAVGPTSAAGGSSGTNSKAHQQVSGGGGGPGGGGMGGRQQQQQQQAFGPAMAATPYPGVGAQYPVPVAVGAAGFMPAPPGQPMFSMAAAGGAIPGAMYTAPAPGVSGAFYPAGVGMGAMGVGAMGMAVPTAPAYSYLATAPGVGVGVGAQGEAITLAPGGAYPVYTTGYPAGATMYPAAAAQMPQPAAMHAAAGTAISMRPMYGVPAFYHGYDPSQYAAGQGMQSQGQGEGRMYGVYGSHYQQHHHHHHNGPHNHGSGGMGGHSGGRGRDSESGGARGESHTAAATSSGGPIAAGNGSSADAK